MKTKEEIKTFYKQNTRRRFIQWLAIELQNKLLKDEFEDAKQIAIWVGEIEWECYNEYMEHLGLCEERG